MSDDSIDDGAIEDGIVEDTVIGDSAEDADDDADDSVDDRILASLEDAEAAEAAYQSLLARAGEQAAEPRLEPTRRAAELLGDPQRAYRIAHVTGTNGKTSTSRIIESLLRAHGLRTGLLTSPHLERVNERILIDGEPVTDEAFARNFTEIEPFLEIVDAELEAAGERRLTFFEALTVLGFAVFADAPVDVVVLEVGMGGEWDSTNVADGDVAVLTPIALDHVGRLGSTVAEIAETKSGIIKPDAIVVTAAQEPAAQAAILAKAESVGARVVSEGAEFAVTQRQVAVGGQLITIRGLAAEYIDQFVPLLGAHQAQNAALAIVAVEAFLGGGTKAIAAEALDEGLGGASSPGRLQVIAQQPTVVIDAAHNPHGAEALARALTEVFAFEHTTLVLGVLVGKDARGVIAALAPVVDDVVITQSESERALGADDLAAVAVEVLGAERVTVEPSLETAIDWARDNAEEHGGAVVAAGSITLVGELLAIARRDGWAVA